jgi:hypothetical protein
LPVADANINGIMIHLPTAAHRTRQITLISIITGGDATTFVRVKGEDGTRFNPTLANASAGLARIAHGFRTSVVLHLSVAAIWVSVNVDVHAETGGSDYATTFIHGPLYSFTLWVHHKPASNDFTVSCH